jgi:uncharacterized protein (TIGR03437 family)
LALFGCVAQAQPLQLSQTGLAFTGYAGGDAADPQSIIITSATPAQVRFRVTSPGKPWLRFKPSMGTTPARISVLVDPSDLAAASYEATIQIADVSTTNAAPVAVPIRFEVEERTPLLDVVPNFLKLDGRDTTDTLFVRNAGGGGRIPFTVAVVGGASWIQSITPMRGIAAPNAPVPVRIAVSTDGLEAGVYRAVLRFNSLFGTEDVPVGLVLGGPSPAIRALPHGFQIDLREGADTALTRRATIFKKGRGVLAWTAEVVEGADLIKLVVASGLSTPAAPSFLKFAIENDGLDAGSYYVLLRITSPQARNSPEYMPIVLNVQGKDIPPRPDLSPAGLFFVAVSGQPPPPAQTVEVDAPTRQPIPFIASGSTDDDLDWLPFRSVTGLTSSSRPGQTTVAVNHAGLPPGVYSGEIVYAFSKTAVSAVRVTLVVLPAGAQPAAAKRRSAEACVPSRLALTQSDLVSNFSIPAGWPAPLTVRLTDDCGTPVTDGQVVLSYSNGDPAQVMSLSDPENGSYSATWVPAREGTSVSITARAASPNLPLVVAQLTGSVAPNKVPILFDNSTVNQFSGVKGLALAPGTMVAIQGSGLASAPATPNVLPLLTNVNGTRVLVGGVEAPLYSVSDEQIRAQIPMELAPNRQYQVLVTANGAYTVPDSITLVAAQPGLQLGEEARVVAQHSDTSMVSRAAPAARGETITFFLVGMGVTDPLVRSGSPAPAGAMAKTLAQPAVMIDSKPAEVIFAGLTPGTVGLYQVRLRVPAEAGQGDLIVSISQGEAQSNPGVLAVR